MAHAAPTGDDLRALEQMRQRLLQITSSIASLKNDVLQSAPLPPWYRLRSYKQMSTDEIYRSSLQNSASILAGNIQALAAHHSKNAELLNRLVVYPATNYPGRTQEGILTQLLRKKNEPSVESWVDEGRSTQASGAAGGKDDEDLSNWAADWINQRIATYITEEAGDMYTEEEREMGIEKVHTGLRRRLEEDDEDDEDDEEMDGNDIAITSARRSNLGIVEYGTGIPSQDTGRKVAKVDDVLRFANSGMLPPELGRR